MLKASAAKNIIAHIVAPVTDLFERLGRVSLFFGQSISASFKRPYRVLETIEHMYFIGNRSVMIIVLTGVFTGIALSFQIYLGFKIVNAVNLVGPTVAFGIAGELGPVLTGLIVAARAGGAMAAQLGTMRVSEQIDALEVMGLDAKQYLVAPRIYAAVIVMPALCAIFDFVAILGSYLLCIVFLGLDEVVFWDKIANNLEPHHIYEGLFKATVFGLIFSVVCVYRGFFTTGGAKGVGESTNRGVVTSMILIIMVDYFLTNLIRTYYVLTGSI